MKIYIASSFDEAALCAATATVLEHQGHQIPDIWWNVKTKEQFVAQDDAAFYSAPIVQAIAARHWRTIRDCDMLLIISNLDRERSFTGANVEAGYALALGKPVVAFGKLKRSAMYSGVIKCSTLDELVNVINCIGLEQR